MASYGWSLLSLYQPRALCAVAPPLLPGLRGGEDVWRGFRAPPRAQVWASLHGWCAARRLPMSRRRASLLVVPHR
eukprot:scaffold14840_cov66-Phaeocystis_antarctica.AAC.1